MITKNPMQLKKGADNFLVYFRLSKKLSAPPFYTVRSNLLVFMLVSYHRIFIYGHFETHPLFLFNISTLRAVDFRMRNQVGYLFDLIPFIYCARTGVSG